MANHKLQIEINEATGEVIVRHYVVVSIGGQNITTWEEIPLEDEGVANLKELGKELIETNRKEMETRATRAAITHAAALKGEATGKLLTFKGSVTATAVSEQTKATEKKN